jgi:DNA-directed RNA polymerase subunit beta
MSSLCCPGGEIVRKSFGKIKHVVSVPNLIEVQSKSFNDFAQLDFLPQERQIVGLEKVFRDIFPIDYGDKISLEYVSYELGLWTCICGKLSGIENRYTWVNKETNETGCSRIDNEKKTRRYITCPNCLSRVGIKLPFTLDEARTAGQSFTMPLRVKIQLTNWDVDQNGERFVRDIKEQDIFFADVPVMADLFEEGGQYKLGSLATFLINGIDRVIVSQLHRSPGVVFAQNKKMKDPRGKDAFISRIIPMRGSWIDFEFDSNDFLYARLDKKKKILVTTFLQALGVSRDEIIPLFYQFDEVFCENGFFYQKLDKSLIGIRIEKDMLDESIEKKYISKRLTAEVLVKLQAAGVDRLLLSKVKMLNRIIGADIIHPKTGEIIAEHGHLIDDLVYDQISQIDGFVVKLISNSGCVIQPVIPHALTQDRCFLQEDALREVHAKIWPGDNASVDEIKERLENVLFNPRFYDLTRVGRVRLNRKLGLSIDEGWFALTREDIFATIRYLIGLRERGEGEIDDIDHLGNRRVRLVGELLANQMYMGMLRVERIARERLRLQEATGALMPQDFLNVKPLSAVVREFFSTGQLSQFMDQTNPLSEIAHKRRLSALGPGGVTKDRATYEVRDVHQSHYGRICPIETPEGQTIGLISSLATYATVNDLGFIETAYHPVQKGVVKNDVIFLDAFEESDKYIAQADSVVSGNNKLKDDLVWARHSGNYMYVESDRIDYIDLSPKQLVSVATALIPFLEHDDASRALMGANMQRQAVPLVRMQQPIVGTGMEFEIARASGTSVTARMNGVVEYVSSECIVIRIDQDEFETFDDWVSQGVQIYHLKKFQRSSHRTWVHQTPIVKAGEVVKKGQMLTNSASVLEGELALGTNLLVAFMPWRGYNFEDAIVLNKRLVAEDVLTSVHIEEYEADARDTKLGPEEITKDIPNVSETALEGLDEDGIVRIGTRVKPGDILVGKVTLKGDVQTSPEEKLLRAIFGEKSREVRDTSLRVPPGVSGTIIDVKVFSRSGVRKDSRYKEIVAQETARLKVELDMQVAILQKEIFEKAVALLDRKKPSVKTQKQGVGETVFEKELLQALLFEELILLKTTDKKAQQEIDHLGHLFESQIRVLNGLHEERINVLKKGDPLPSGVIKKVKVYVAMKRPIQVGDKIAGRHGNKGVISTIVPREDMPYLDDGTAVDVVLNPLGVPSRMNVGQILETVLGYVGKVVGDKIDAAYKAQNKKAIYDILRDAYGDDFITEYERLYGIEGLELLVQKSARCGIFYRTPVFDGADFQSDILPILKSNGLSETGAYYIRDGRTGEYFDQPVTVGVIYMMKLNHMVDDKLHARSVGPYSLVTQQPLGGKAQMGGQRFGEMEVWALEAYGAAYSLREMLTYKSDDVGGRHKVYDAIVRGEEIPDPGLPESFNVLIKEFQSLGLRVDLFKSAKEDVSE